MPSSVATEEKALTLHDVADELRCWADTIDGMEEDDPERETAIARQAAAVTQGKDKAEGFARFLLRLEAEAAFAKSERDRLNARMKRLEALQDKLSGFGVTALHDAKLRKIEGHTLALALRKGPETVSLTDEAAVPSDYKTLVISVSAKAWEEHLTSYIGYAFAADVDESKPAILDSISGTEVKIDKRRLLKDLKAGQEIAGAERRDGTDSLQVKS